MRPSSHGSLSQPLSPRLFAWPLVVCRLGLRLVLVLVRSRLQLKPGREQVVAVHDGAELAQAQLLVAIRIEARERVARDERGRASRLGRAVRVAL